MFASSLADNKLLTTCWIMCYCGGVYFILQFLGVYSEMCSVCKTHHYRMIFAWDAIRVYIEMHLLYLFMLTTVIFSLNVHRQLKTPHMFIWHVQTVLFKISLEKNIGIHGLKDCVCAQKRKNRTRGRECALVLWKVQKGSLQVLHCALRVPVLKSCIVLTAALQVSSLGPKD